eukprot:1136293-Pelagomonas_calceolata.AAC.2
MLCMPGPAACIKEELPNLQARLGLTHNTHDAGRVGRPRCRPGMGRIGRIKEGQGPCVGSRDALLHGDVRDISVDALHNGTARQLFCASCTQEGKSRDPLLHDDVRDISVDALHNGTARQLF